MKRNRILRRVNALDLLNELGLEKVREGFTDNISASCPFHADRRPSFGMHTGTTQWNCFSCGARGDAITLVQKVKNFSFDEAMIFLENLFGIIREDVWKLTLPEYEDYFGRKEDSPVVLPEEELLRFIPVGFKEIILDKRLQTNPRNIKKFEISYDKVLQRIVFPIRDPQKKLLGFIGRAISPEIKPRYYVYGDFSPGRTLFGLDKFDYSSPYLMLVEGAFDAFVAHKFGFTSTLATFSARATKYQLDYIRQLSRGYKAVIVAFDNDSAGNIGAWFTYQQLKKHCEIYCVSYPEGVKDIGEMNMVSIRRLVATRKSVFDLQIKELPKWGEI